MKYYFSRKHSIRQAIIDALYKYDDDRNSPDIADLQIVSLTFSGLEEHTKLGSKSIASQIEFLLEEGEINSFEREYTDYYYITRKGRIAYFLRKHLANARKEFWNDSYDIVKTVSAVIILVIAVATFVKTCSDTNTNKREIERLSKEVSDMKSAPKK